MDVVDLSRFQFALTSCFHYIFPPLSIGLGLMLVIFEGMYIKTKDVLYKDVTKFWVKVFSLTFALGVATGIVQLFGFGTNWARYSRYVGDVFGSALGAEGIFAFFLEAGFLGVVLFGWERVSAKVHYMATVLVALGAHFSAIWIVVANSWMQTPRGYKIIGEGENTKAVVTDFWEMVFNPSSVDRLIHVILGCWLAGIFLVVSISAFYFLKKRHLDFARVSMKAGLVMAAVTLVLQLISADSTARGVAVNQPAKLAAIEGVYKTEEYTPMTIFGAVDEKNQTVSGWKIPGLLSFLTFRDFKTPIKGLDQIPRDEWPPVQPVFQSYHLMIYMWGLMALCTIFAIFFWWKGTIEKKKWLLWGLIFSVGFPQVGNQVGWITAEVGRQPWIVWKLLRTYEGVSKTVASGQVLGSIIMLIIIYAFLLVMFLYLLNNKIQEGPTKEKEPLFQKGALGGDHL